jgi:hypothetical protein
MRRAQRLERGCASASIGGLKARAQVHIMPSKRSLSRAKGRDDLGLSSSRPENPNALIKVATLAPVI